MIALDPRFSQVDPKAIETAALFGSFLKLVADPKQFSDMVDSFTAQVTQLNTLLGVKNSLDAVEAYKAKVEADLKAKQDQLDKDQAAFQALQNDFETNKISIQNSVAETQVQVNAKLKEAEDKLTALVTRSSELDQRQAALDTKESNLTQLNNTLADQKAVLDAKIAKLKELA